MTTIPNLLAIAGLCAALAACDRQPQSAPAPDTSALPGAVAGADPEVPRAFAACDACHAAGAGQHGIGPSLAGVFGSPSAAKAQFGYSPALRRSGLVWDEETLHRFLADPRGTVPGTSMAYAGLRDAARRKEIIDWLKTI